MYFKYNIYSKCGGFMIVKGSMRYTPSGRLRKNIIRSGKRRVEFMQLHTEKEIPRRETKEYPSAPLTPYKPQPRDDWKSEASSEYTIAPAYNKGAYQVISRENVKDIGK